MKSLTEKLLTEAHKAETLDVARAFIEAALMTERDGEGFTVRLQSVAEGKKIEVIKAIRNVIDVGLREAKDLVEGAPSLIAKFTSEADAKKLRLEIAAAGGTAEIE